jgi:hypothetical protein
VIDKDDILAAAPPLYLSQTRERGWFSNREGDGNTSYVRELSVGENLIDVSGIERRSILTVWSQVQDSHSEECSDCSRE